MKRMNSCVEKHLIHRRLTLRMGFGLLAPSLILPVSSASSEKNISNKLKERHAFITAANKEPYESASRVIVDGGPDERSVQAVMVVAALMPFADWDYYYIKGGSIGWGPSQPVTKEELSSVQKLEVTVPEGFVTDLASIPRLLWSIQRPEGRHAYAAVIHDYLYWTQRRTRLESDEIFREILLETKTDKKIIAGLYSAVRKAGGGAWRKNQRLKDKGEKRFLSKLPEDPLVSWASYKKQPDVFVQSEGSR